MMQTHHPDVFAELRVPEGMWEIERQYNTIAEGKWSFLQGKADNLLQEEQQPPG
jgi:hypothetical protein